MIEDLHTEFKESWADKYLRNIAAFANTDGGTLYIGIDDKGNVVGVDDFQSLLKILPDKIDSNLGIVPTVDNHVENGLNYISVTVKHSDEPIFYGSKLYVKSGSTTREIPRSELRLFLSRNPENAWANSPAEGLDFKDIDTYAFREFKKRAKEYREFTDSELDLPMEALLDKLDLVSNGHPTRAAAILFCNHPTEISAAAQIRIGRIRNAEFEFSDELDAPLYLQVDMIIELIKTKYTTSPMTYDGLANIENHPYPLDCIREAVLNAVINTDYELSVPIKIMVYDDHMEILNFGGLPYGTDLDTIIRNHVSNPRNVGMASTFRKAHYVEKYGRGFEKMTSLYKDSGVDPPTFDASDTFFCAKFTDIVHAKGIVARDFNGEPLPKKGGVTSQRKPELQYDDLTKIQKGIISLISENPGMSAISMAESLNVSERTVRRNLSKLISAGVVMRIGSDKSGSWSIVERR
ncbi:MAG: ATP-binding protein [Candidatus Methanomethylophilaceae archaeon]